MPPCGGVRRGDLEPGWTGEVVGLAGGRLGLDPLPLVGLETGFETGVGLGGALDTLLTGSSTWPLLFAKMAASSALTFVEGSAVLLAVGLRGCGLAG